MENMQQKMKSVLNDNERLQSAKRADSAGHLAQISKLEERVHDLQTKLAKEHTRSTQLAEKRKTANMKLKDAFESTALDATR